MLKSTVLPTFERLHAEIKNKQKDLDKGAGKQSKALDKARTDTQKHVQRLGSSSASYNSATAKDAENDPYVLQRGINHRLHKQFLEENASRQDMLSVQNNFAQFEAHVVRTLQQGLGQFDSAVAGQADQQKQLYNITTQTAQAVDPSHEWNLFVRRNNSVLVDPNGPPRSLANATFPHQHHESTKPMIQGALERKGGMLRKYDVAFYVVTPSKFLHEFKSEDDIAKDPAPELSLFLPDCTIGALNGNLFSLKGKDVSKGKVGAAMSLSKEYELRANNGRDAEMWYRVISNLAGLKPGQAAASPTSPSSVTSPTGSLASREKQDARNPTSVGSGQTTGTTHPTEMGTMSGAQATSGAGTGLGNSNPSSVATSGVAGQDMAPSGVAPGMAVSTVRSSQTGGGAGIGQGISSEIPGNAGEREVMRGS